MKSEIEENDGIVPNRPSADSTLCAAERRKFGASAGGKTWERANLTAPKVSSRRPLYVGALGRCRHGIVPNRPSSDLTLCAAERRRFGASAGGKTWESANLTAPRVSSRHPPVSCCFGTVSLRLAPFLVPGTPLASARCARVRLHHSHPTCRQSRLPGTAATTHHR